MFADAFSAMPEPAFLEYIPALVELNSSRLPTIWQQVMAYIRSQTPVHQIHALS